MPAQQPVYKPKNEQELMAELWSENLKDDPYAFVMFMFPWGKPNTPLEHHTGPREWQKQKLDELKAHIEKNKQQPGKATYETLRTALSSGRGIGKSSLVCWIILWMLTTRIGSSVIVSANSENQLRSVTWGELTKWTAMAINSHWWEISATKLTPAQWLATLVERDLKKGTRYWAAEGRLWSAENPDSYAGVHNHDGTCLIFDEASGIDDKIWAVSAGFFTEQTPDRYWFAFSNPRRNSGYFYECFNAKREYWQTQTIDARTVEDTDKDVYEQIINEYGEDSLQARVEVYGEFPSTGDAQFIGRGLVDEAFKRQPHNDDTAPIIVGVDPARTGMDSTVIVIRQGRDLVEVARYKTDDLMETVGNIIDVIERYKPEMVCIDEGGLGAGVVDRLKEQGYKVRGVNAGWKPKNPKAHLNLRAQMWCDMREWLKTASVKHDKRLMTDLTGIEQKFTSTGAIQLESKKDMKARGLASPDSADAIAHTFAFRVAHKDYSQHRPKKKHSGYIPGMSSSWMVA